MKFTNDFIEAADKFFNALKKLDGSAPVEATANSTTVVEPPVVIVATPEVQAEAPVADAKPVDASVKTDDTIDELKKKIDTLAADLASVKTNLNSSIGLNTELTEKLAVILKAPAEGTITKVENSRPAEVKNDFKLWDEVINSRLNHKSKT